MLCVQYLVTYSFSRVGKPTLKKLPWHMHYQRRALCWDLRHVRQLDSDLISFVCVCDLTAMLVITRAAFVNFWEIPCLEEATGRSCSNIRICMGDFPWGQGEEDKKCPGNFPNVPVLRCAVWVRHHHESILHDWLTASIAVWLLTWTLAGPMLELNFPLRSVGSLGSFFF